MQMMSRVELACQSSVDDPKYSLLQKTLLSLVEDFLGFLKRSPQVMEGALLIQASSFVLFPNVA